MERISFSNQDMSYAVREELKTLRTNIQFCGDDKRVILVTSCLAGEGKSTMTIGLADGLALPAASVAELTRAARMTGVEL